MLFKERSVFSHLCCIEITGSFVRIQVFENDSNVCVWKHQESVRTAAKDVFSVRTKDVELALFQALLEYNSKGLRSVSKQNSNPSIQYSAIYSTPWSYICTKHVSLVKETPFRVTADLMKEIKRNALSHTNEIAKVMLFDTKQDPLIVTSSIKNLCVNGYALTKPMDAIGEEVSATVWLQCVDKNIASVVTDNLKKIHINSTPSQHTSIGYYMESTEAIRSNDGVNYLIIVEDLSTTVVGFSERAIESIEIIPFGHFVIARKIAKLLSITDEEALVCLSGTCSELTKALGENKKKEFNKTVTAHNAIFIDALRVQMNKNTTPDSVFLVCKEIYREYVQNVLKDAISEVYNQKINTILLDSAPWLPKQR